MQAASVSKTPATATSTDAQVGAGDQVYTVCSESYKIARPGCPETMELVFPAGSLTEYCDVEH